MPDKKITELDVAKEINASDVSVLVSGDTDYQYTFTLLLQYLSDNLPAGNNISFGTTLPQNTNGQNGDLFINTATGSFAQRLSGTWTIVYTLPAATGADGTLLYGAGIPGTATGKNGDSYINTLTGIFYQKTNGNWLAMFTMANGPQGAQGPAGTNGTNGTNGNAVLFGSTIPSNTSKGVNGDFYINTSNYTLFGPKTNNVWGTGESLLGAGVTAGGTTGQILKKASNDDYDTGWANNGFAELAGQPGDNANLASALAAKQNLLGYAPENTANRNQPNGYAGLDSTGKVAAAQLPAYVDDVLEFATYATLPATGETGKIYVTLSDNKEYRWSGSTYIQLLASPGSTDAVPEGSSNLYFTAVRVLTAVLTGIGFSSATALSATDTILGALGKLQAQITALFKIPAGGTAGQVLAKVDATDGNTHWITASAGGGGGSPGGSSGQVQFNNSGAFGGDAGLTFDAVNKVFYAKVKSGLGFSIDSPSATGLGLLTNGNIFGIIGSGSNFSSIHTNPNDLIISTNGGVLSIETSNTFFSGNVHLPSTGQIGSGSTGILYGANSNFYWVWAYGSNGSSTMGFTNSANGLSSYQNGLDFLLNGNQNFGIGNGSGSSQDCVYAQFMQNTKSLVLNGGGDFYGDASALLKLDSTSRGFLPSRMTTTQKNSIINPTEGLIVYDNTIRKLCIFTGTTWESVASS